MNRANDLYWLAFLLTGDREVSVDAAVDALDHEDSANPFFSTWMATWERKVVISKALAAIRDELAASARRTEAVHGVIDLSMSRSRALQGGVQKADLERALLGIDVLPRCALLLRMFEGLSVDDTTILLDCSRELLHKAEMIGLCDLTRALTERGQSAIGGVALQGAF